MGSVRRGVFYRDKRAAKDLLRINAELNMINADLIGIENRDERDKGVFKNLIDC